MMKKINQKEMEKKLVKLGVAFDLDKVNKKWARFVKVKGMYYVKLKRLNDQYLYFELVKLNNKQVKF